MIEERDISTISVNMVIEALVRFLDFSMGPSSLSVQLGILGAAPEGVFSPRDDGDKVRAALSVENAMVSRVELAGLWKRLGPLEVQVIWLLNSPGRHEQYEETVPTSVDLREHEIVVGLERDQQNELTGTRVLRSGRNDHGADEVARRLGLKRSHVEKVNRSARMRIRRAIWEKHAAGLDALCDKSQNGHM